MKKIEAIIKPFKLDDVKTALNQIGIAGICALIVLIATVNVTGAIVELARKRDVAAIVVGSRGLTGLRARLEGSTSNAVAKHASCPVVLVHDD